MLNLSVPGTVTLGSRVRAEVRDAVTGSPIPGISVIVTSPEGEEILLVSGKDGAVSYSASEIGVYQYGLPEARVAQPKSTNSQAPPVNFSFGTGPVPTPAPVAVAPKDQTPQLPITECSAVAFGAVLALAGLYLIRRSRPREPPTPSSPA